MDIDYEVERVVEEYSNMIYKIALSYLENKYDAEDILQDVMIKYISFIKSNKFNDRNHEKCWLIRVTMNLCCNEVKSAKHKKNVSYDNCIKELFITNEDNNCGEIFDLIGNLKEKYRIVFELFYIHDMKISEISKTLNISESNVKIRLMRAKKTIQEHLQTGEAI